MMDEKRLLENLEASQSGLASQQQQITEWAREAQFMVPTNYAIDYSRLGVGLGGNTFFSETPSILVGKKLDHRKMYRQGDVLLIEVEAFNSHREDEDDDWLLLPNKTLKTQPRDDQNRLVLEYGEVTGHAHAIKHPGAELQAIDTGLRLLKTYREVELTHEEHAPIKLPAKKTFQVIRQREYVYGETRYVAD